MQNANELENKLRKATEQIKLMRKIRTREGFYSYWFENLPNFKTRLECFNYVNNLHVELFGEEKYSSYRSFEHSINRNKRKK